MLLVYRAKLQVDRHVFKADCVHVPILIGDQPPRALSVAAASQPAYLNLLPAKKNSRQLFFAAGVNHKYLFHASVLPALLRQCVLKSVQPLMCLSVQNQRLV
jgi:hypothetical protein